MSEKITENKIILMPYKVKIEIEVEDLDANSAIEKLKYEIKNGLVNVEDMNIKAKSM